MTMTKMNRAPAPGGARVCRPPRSPTAVAVVALLLTGILLKSSFWVNCTQLVGEIDYNQWSGPSASSSNSKGIFATGATRCTQPMVSFPRWYRSQAGEDRILMRWFQNVCHDRFLEMGALDGYKFSNSYVFERAMNWTGLLIEASPRNYADLVKNRVGNTNVHAAVCREAGIVHWYESDRVALGGIWEFSKPTFRDKWWPRATIEDTTEIPCLPLTDLVQKHLPEANFFDFFSLDVSFSKKMDLA